MYWCLHLYMNLRFKSVSNTTLSEARTQTHNPVKATMVDIQWNHSCTKQVKKVTADGCDTQS